MNGIESTKAAYAQNRFGFSAGGPLFVPKLFSFPKSFWFINYTGNLVRNGDRFGVNEPTAAERGGKFFRSPTPSTIPRTAPVPRQHRFQRSGSARSRRVARLLPHSESARCRRESELPPDRSESEQFPESEHAPQHHHRRRKDTLAITFNLPEAQRLHTIRYSDVATRSTGHGNNTNVNWRHRIGTRSFNNFTLLYNRNVNTTVPFFENGPNIAATIGIEGTSPDPLDFGPPTLSFPTSPA